MGKNPFDMVGSFMAGAAKAAADTAGGAVNAAAKAPVMPRMLPERPHMMRGRLLGTLQTQQEKLSAMPRMR